jgi:large subunit ribosomal protein L18e
METNVHLKLLIASLRKKSEFWNEVSTKLSVPARKRVTVNLGSLNEYADGETVVIPGKLVAGGQLTKKLNIACWRFSEAVLNKVTKSGSKLVSLHDLSAKDEKGDKLRIIA